MATIHTWLDVGKLGKNCPVEGHAEASEPSRPWRDLARDGLVQVREYRCAAGAGDPPQVEQFGQTCIAIVRSGVFGIRSERRAQVLTTGFLLLGNARQPYETSHEHGGG